MKKTEIIKAVAESTGEDKKIVADICNASAYNVVKFTSAKNLKDGVNGR